MEDTLCQFSFLFWSEVFSVYTVSRDTYDNIFTAHDLFVNSWQVHNVQVKVLSTVFEVSVKDSYEVINLFVASLTKGTRWYLSSKWDTVSCITEVKACKWVQVLQPSTFSFVRWVSTWWEEFQFRQVHWTIFVEVYPFVNWRVTSLFRVSNVRSDCKKWNCSFCIFVEFVATKTSSVSFNQPFCQFVWTWVIFTPTWVFTDCFVVVDVAIFVTDWFNCSVFDCWQCINSICETTDTESHVSTLFSWQEGHLNSFVVVLISHVVDDVKGIYISVSQPVKRFFEVSFNSVKVKNFITDWIDVKYFVVFMNIVVTTVQTSKKGFKYVNTSTEVLDVVALFFVFWVKWWYTTWDTAHFTVSVFSHSSHTFVLNRRVLVTHVHTVATEWVRQFVRPKNCQVWFWSITNIIKCVQETVVHFSNTVTSVSTHTSHRSCDECWVTWVKFVVSFCTCEFYSTKFQDKIINEFLDFWFSVSTTSKITFCIYVKDDWHTTKWSSRTIDNTTYSHKSNVCPLDSFFSIEGWTTNIYTVKVTKANNILKCLVLKVNFFTKTNSFFVDFFDRVPVVYFFLHQEVSTVKSKASINTDDTSTRVSIWKSSYSVCVTCTTDIWCISTEDTVIYCSYMFCKNFVNSWIRFIAMFLESCFCHTNSAFWHEIQFE